jgi:hypothetical protein
MGLLEYVSVDEIRARGSIKDSDVLKLRRALYEDASIAPAEADLLFHLNDACAVKDAGWADFFIEAITDYIVNQAEPEGYIVAENAAWLMQRISDGGRVRSRTELELLIKVLEQARWSPPSLVGFAMQQVKEAVLTGSGPIRATQTPEPGAIAAAEVQLLRRLLFAFGGDGNIAVTRAEAQALIDINKALGPGRSDPEFTRLFVQAVANAVLHGLGLSVPAREEALRSEADREAADEREAGSLILDAFSGGPSGSTARARLGGFMGRMIPARAAEAWGTHRAQSSEERALARLERQRLEIITNEKIEEADAQWLAGQLGRGGKLDDNERALLDFLRRETPALPPALQKLIDGAGHAA